MAAAADRDQLSGAEQGEGLSTRRLRGPSATSCSRTPPVFSDDAGVVLKFHGVYQQDDRDLRKEARRLGLDKHHMMMIRTRIPGGIVSPDAYLAHDRIAGEWGNGTLRVTTRQDLQLHGVLKGDLKKADSRHQRRLLTTLGGCGDQERNMMCCPAPWHDRLHHEIHQTLAALVTGLTPTTRAYSEIWLDGELAASNQPDPPDTLYGERYLPRKFKTAIAIEGDNCVDIYANDLGLVAHARPDGSLDGFDLLVGGGMGRTANKPNTWPAVAQPLASCDPNRRWRRHAPSSRSNATSAVRSDRRHARLKYLIADRGIEWFRAEVRQRLPFALEPSRSLDGSPPKIISAGTSRATAGTATASSSRTAASTTPTATALRVRAARDRRDTAPELRLTPQQNVLFTNVSHEIARAAGDPDRWGLHASSRCRNAITVLDGLSRVSDLRARGCRVGARDAER